MDRRARVTIVVVLPDTMAESVELLHWVIASMASAPFPVTVRVEAEHGDDPR